MSREDLDKLMSGFPGTPELVCHNGKATFSFSVYGERHAHSGNIAPGADIYKQLYALKMELLAKYDKHLVDQGSEILRHLEG